MLSCLGSAGSFSRCFSAPAGATRSTVVKEIAVVNESQAVEDPIPKTSEARHPAAEALRSGRLAITFSGGGFLLPYFIGVADALQQQGVLRPGRATPLAGSSAGSLIAASLACGLTPAQMYDSFLDSVCDCRTNGSYRRLDDVLGRQLEATLPADAAERCSGVATVSVTRVFPRPRTQRFSSFSSRADLIAALKASCHIPGYFNGEMTTSFRGKISVDGGVTALMPEPMAPHDFLLKVCCFPRAHVARLPVFNRRRALHQLSLGITPEAFQPWPYSFRDMMAAALHPRSDTFISQLLEAGRSDATKWVEAVGAAQQNLPPLRPFPHHPPAAAAASAVAAVAAEEGPQPEAVAIVAAIVTPAGAMQTATELSAAAAAVSAAAAGELLCTPEQPPHVHRDLSPSSPACSGSSSAGPTDDGGVARKPAHTT